MHQATDGYVPNRVFHLKVKTTYSILLPLTRMATSSHIFSYLYTLSTFFIGLLFLEIAILFQSIAKASRNKRATNSTNQYLQLIEEKNPTIIYRGESMRHDEEEAIIIECPVCLSELLEGEQIRKSGCEHVFHRDCLDNWLQQYLATCPLCRTKVLPDNVVANYQYHQYQLENQVEHDVMIEDVVDFLFSPLHGNNSYHRFF